MYPESLKKLIFVLKRLPGVGEKTAERYAFKLLNENKEQLNEFIEALTDIQNIKHCKCCGNVSDDDFCEICKDKTRNQEQVMVVQEPKDIIALEKSEAFNGKYHVLGGLIAPNKGIMPEDLNIDSLISRIESEGIKEIIIATDPTVDGETTALYLSKLLNNYDVKVSRIANGIPMGGNLDYVDGLTLFKAIEGRTEYKKND